MKINIVLGILLITSIFFNIKQKDSNDGLKAIYKHNFTVAHDSIKYLTDRYDQSIAEKKAYEITLRDIKSLNDSLQILIKNYKPKIITRFRIKYIYKDSINIKYDTIIKEKFNVPFRYKSRWININGIGTNLGIDINKIEIPNTQSLIIGYKKDNFFSTPYANVRIANTNPYLKINKIDSYIIKQKSTIKDDWWLWIGIGALASIIIFK